jgi:hypothetical protein
MRRLLVALAVAGLVASASGAVAQASGFDDARPSPGAVLTPDQIGITQPGQGFFPFFAGASGQNGSNLGGIGLGGVAPVTLGPSALFGACGVFSIAFCPLFSAAPFSQTFLLANGGSLGLGSPLQALLNNNVGLGGVGINSSLFGTGTNFGLGGSFGVFGNGLTGTGLGTGFGTSLGGRTCTPQGAFIICQ